MRFIAVLIILMAWFPLFSADLTTDNIPESEKLWNAGSPLMGVKATDTGRVRPVVVGDKGAIATQLTALNSDGDVVNLLGNTTEGTLKVQLYYKKYDSDELLPFVGGADGCVWTNCYNNEVSLGNVMSVETGYKFGMGTVATTLEAVWDYAVTHTAYNYITDDYANGSKLWISSSSTDDDGVGTVGTGALSFEVYGLAPVTFLPINETINLNGQATVETTLTYARVFKAFTSKCGTGGVNAGNIFVHRSAVSSGTPSTAGNVYAMVTAGYGQTLMAVYTVPAGKKMLVWKFQIGSEASKSVEAQAFVREFGTSSWRTRLPSIAYQAPRMYEFEYPIVIPEKADVEIRAKVDSGTGKIDAEWYYLLIDEE